MLHMPTHTYKFLYIIVFLIDNFFINYQSLILQLKPLITILCNFNLYLINSLLKRYPVGIEQLSWGLQEMLMLKIGSVQSILLLNGLLRVGAILNVMTLLRHQGGWLKMAVWFSGSLMGKLHLMQLLLQLKKQNLRFLFVASFSYHIFHF